MSEHLDFESPSPIPWYTIWIKAITHPTVATFEQIASLPGAGYKPAYIWISLSSLIVSLPALFCAPVFGVVLMTAVVCYILITHGLAHLFKGTGEQGQLTFTMAAYIAPLLLIAGIANWLGEWLSGVGFVMLGVLLYGLVLGIVTVKAVHQLNWRKAIAVNSVLPGVGICGLLGLITLFLSLAYPVFVTGNNFTAALKEANYEQAYTLCSTSLQEELGSPIMIETILAELGTQIDQWSWWANFNIEDEQADFSRPVTFTNGETGLMELLLVETEVGWRIDGFNVTVGDVNLE